MTSSTLKNFQVATFYVKPQKPHWTGYNRNLEETKENSLTNSGSESRSDLLLNSLIPSLLGRMGVPEERSNSVMAKQANCEPSPTVVPTYERNDPSIVYFPRCTRVKRCTGCCGSELLSCQPKEIETRNFEVRQLDKYIITDKQ